MPMIPSDETKNDCKQTRFFGTWSQNPESHLQWDLKDEDGYTHASVSQEYLGPWWHDSQGQRCATKRGAQRSTEEMLLARFYRMQRLFGVKRGVRREG
jgi:hypothetical protein